MTKTDTKTAEALEQEFDFGNIDVGDQLDVESLDTVKEERVLEEPEESEEAEKPVEESTEEKAESEEETEEAEEESEEKEDSEESEEESEELTTEEVLGDPLKDKEEEKDEKGRSYEGYDDEDKQYAKQMSNSAYEHFSKKLQKLKISLVVYQG